MRATQGVVAQHIRGMFATGLGVGSKDCRPATRAMQSSCRGHIPQAGRVRVQSVAPRSMMACV